MKTQAQTDQLLSYSIMTFCSSVWFMHCIWDTKMNKTDPPQLGGTKGGGMFEVGGWEKWGRQAAVTEQHTVTGASQVESVLWEQHRQLSTGPCRGDGQLHWEWKGEIWDDVGSISRGPGKNGHEVLLQEDMCRHTQLEQTNNGAGSTVYKENYNELNHGVG